MLGGLFFCGLSFVLTILLELNIAGYLERPMRPYGPPTSLAIFTSTLLGLFIGRIVELIRSRTFNENVSPYLLGLLCITGSLIYSIRSWVRETFDSSVVIVFGGLSVSIVISYVVFLCWYLLRLMKGHVHGTVELPAEKTSGQSDAP